MPSSPHADWKVEPLLAGTFYSSSCTLLTTAGHHVIVDTGLSLQEGALLSALRERHLDAADIDLVVNTHLHLDHCSNNILFPRARVFMSRAEWEWMLAFYDAILHSRTPEKEAPRFYPELDAHGLKPRTIRNVARLARLLWDPKRVGDPGTFQWLESAGLPDGLELLQTPGHTPHHISIRVPSARTIVAGDAVLNEDVDAKVRTMIPHSQAVYLETRRALLARGERIVPGHGPAFLSK